MKKFLSNNIVVIQYIVFIICYVAKTKEAEGFPVNNSQIPNSVTHPQIMEFMRRFGYMERISSDSESLYLESSVVDAIKNVQKFGSIKQTGILDNDTLNLMTSPRCGVEDITTTSSRNRRYIIGGKQWQKRNITFFIANWSSKIGEQNVSKYMKKAFHIWSKYSRLNFEEIHDPSADIVIGFGRSYHGDNYPFDGPGNILAHAFYPYEMNSFGGDIHFDEDENWVENSTTLADGVDFYTVALHELGHSLGLAHSPVYASVMFPYYKGSGSNNLDYDDVLALYKLYITKTFMDEDIADYNTDATSEIVEITSTTALPPTIIPTSVTELSTFVGDYGTVEEHNRNNAMPTNESMKDPPVDICLGHFDTVSVLNRSTFIFKGNYAWKISDTYDITKNNPIRIHKMFPFLPAHVNTIDAIYERPDKMVSLFSGNHFWTFNWILPNNVTTRPLISLRIPKSVTKLDAAMQWPKNNHTYLFAGNQFWRYEEESDYPMFGYPKSTERWNGIPENIDAAITTPKGNTYFFKGNLFWLFNNIRVRPAHRYPRRISSAWLGCPLRPRTRLRNL